MQDLDAFLQSPTSGPGLCPSWCDMFKAFALTPLDTVRVVIVGHDPYTDGRATGLAFAVPNGASTKGSINSISRELLRDTRRRRAAGNELTEWAEQGVLLLNCALSARPGAKRAFSHGERRWRDFTDRAIELVDQQRDRKVVFCLWGTKTWAKASRINPNRHYMLPMAGHPAARANAAVPFAGCAHFSQVNRRLRGQEQQAIIW